MPEYRDKCEACKRPLAVLTWKYCDRKDCIYKRSKKKRDAKKRKINI